MIVKWQNDFCLGRKSSAHGLALSFRAFSLRRFNIRYFAVDCFCLNPSGFVGVLLDIMHEINR